MDRWSDRTRSVYNAGWQLLGKFVEENTAVHDALLRHTQEDKILTVALHHFAQHLHKNNKSASSYNHAAAAVAHFLSAHKGDLVAVRQHTARTYRRQHPANRGPVSVPDLHAFFDRIEALSKIPTEKAARQRAAFLMLILGVQRPSDICRIWRHSECLRFRVKKLDAPSWSKPHNFDTIHRLQKLGYLKNFDTNTITEHHFIIFQFRAYHPKTSLTKNFSFSNWVSLVENRFYIQLCPIRAITTYLEHTNNYKIEQKMKISQNHYMTFFTSDFSNTRIRSTPLFISLSGKIRTSIIPDTLAGEVRRELIRPLHLRYKPYILRHTAVSYLKAYGIDSAVIRILGFWEDDKTFMKHYLANIFTPINKSRVSDATYHCWTLARAHMLSKESLSNTQHDTRNDSAKGC